MIQIRLYQFLSSDTVPNCFLNDTNMLCFTQRRGILLPHFVFNAISTLSGEYGEFDIKKNCIIGSNSSLKQAVSFSF